MKIIDEIPVWGEALPEALRKCRHPQRKKLVDALTHKDLRKDILGEDE